MYIIPKVRSACFAMMIVISLLTIDTLKLVYFAYFNSSLTYGVTFWGNSPERKKVFSIPKKIIRIKVGVVRNSLLSLLLFIVDNMEKFKQILAYIVHYKTWAFRDVPHQMLKVIHFGKHCSCHLQGEYMLVQQLLEYRTGSRWQVGCDGANWSGRAGCYPIGDEHVVRERR
jgi:hypothetical protein